MLCAVGRSATVGRYTEEGRQEGHPLPAHAQLQLRCAVRYLPTTNDKTTLLSSHKRHSGSAACVTCDVCPPQKGVHSENQACFGVLASTLPQRKQASLEGKLNKSSDKDR